MSGQTEKTIDVEKMIIELLNKYRKTLGRTEIESLALHEGAWRAVVKPAKSWPDGYASVFSEIEESAFDQCGVNVMLVPVKPD